jgi:hypothetical protein
MMALGKGRSGERGDDKRRESQLGGKRIHFAFSEITNRPWLLGIVSIALHKTALVTGSSQNSYYISEY